MPRKEPSANARRVAATLITSHGGLERPRLIQQVGLSRPTVTKAVAELIHAKAVEEVASRSRKLDGEIAALWSQSASEEATRGRPPRILKLTKALGVTATIDLGFRHLAVGILDANLEVVFKQRIQGEDPQPRARTGGRSAEPSQDVVNVELQGLGVLQQAIQMLRGGLEQQGLRARDLRGVAIGVPAPLIRSTGMLAVPAVLSSWAEVPVAKAASEALTGSFGDQLAPDLPVIVDSVANLSLLGEIVTRRDPSLTDVLLIRVSSGISGSLYLSGQIHNGHNGLAGGLGHLSVPATWSRGQQESWTEDQLRPPQLCPSCGRRDCLEQVASGRAILAEVQASSRGRGAPANLTAVLDAATRTDFEPLSRRAVVNAAVKVGAVLGEAATLLDPQLALIAGELARGGALVARSAEEGLRRHTVLSRKVPVEPVPLERSKLVSLIGGGTIVWDKVAPGVLAGTQPVLTANLRKPVASRPDAGAVRS